MQGIKQSNKTVLFVSHSVMQMQGFCDKVIWIHQGKIIGVEQPEKILMPYCGFAREYNMMSHEDRKRLEPDLREYQEKYL